ncbi:D-beta-hydroxybutyrate dehydrogenase, mitochondrial-like [Amphiura filiformis]|uniref:D-beta-hydroxybutyrate dehydrogenase, mitochondrial-like n=1 Tax=Amphiura filiformis TaxID=82378 RepID=UPI003B225E8E
MGIVALFVWFVVLVTAGGLFIAFVRGEPIRLEPRNKAVLITGCDTGFGHALAAKLDDIGFNVFAGCLDSRGDGARKLQEGASSRLLVVQMDVSKDEGVQAALATVKQNLPEPKRGLWGIVNNAGLSTFGEVEWCNLDVYERTAQVNLFGCIRVTKAFLPLVRRAKGRVVTITSGIARQAIPSRSVYVTSKYAMEGFCQCLRYEMKRWGVHVSIIEPGNFVAATGIFTKENIQRIGDKMWEAMPEEVRQDYGRDDFDKKVATMAYYSNIGTRDKTPVIDSFVGALLDKYPKIRYEPKDWYWHMRTFIMTHLPAVIGDNIYIY